MPNILSIQSHVAYGYVGNKAAVFPLQRLGNEVIAINTVQFSNHTGYGSWTGDIMSIEHIDKIFEGLQARGVFSQLDAVLTGYLGDSLLGENILKWIDVIKTDNPRLIYCCDPVIGDLWRGIFVRPGVPEFFANEVLSYASILTPNQFELQYLTGIEINDLSHALSACDVLHANGVECVLITSLEYPEIVEKSEIAMLVSTKSNRYIIRTPKLVMPIAPNGSGDMTAALFLANFLKTNDFKLALEYVASVIYGVFKQTLELNQRELAIIAAQDQFINPIFHYKATKL